MAEVNEPVEQSLEHGLKVVMPVLEHPSKKFKSKENININWKLLLKWGTVSLIDLCWSLLLLTRFRFFIIPFLSEKKKKTFRLFTEADAIFVKGGGFVHSYGGKTALYYIYFQLYHIFLAQSLKKDVYVCPNSFGPFEGWGVKTLVKKAFRKLRMITARENRSSNMCKQDLGIGIPVYPDFGFFLPNSGKNNKAEFMESLNIPSGRKIVAITARPHRFLHSTNPQKSYIDFVESMRHFATWLYSEGYFPVFVEHVYAINDHENDSYCIKQIIKGMNSEKYAFFSNRKLNCCELKQIYGYFDYIVGTRFHSMIFSMTNHVPGIAITYVGNKGEGIMEDMGLQDYYLRIDNVTFNNLKQKFEYLVQTEETVKNKINDYLKSAKEQRRVLINIIRK